jgi:two-component system OmpR family sensor kinase
MNPPWLQDENQMTNRPGMRRPNSFRRRITLALAALGAIAAVQGAIAIWSVGSAERHVLRGRVAADIKHGFIELRSDKQQLRNWVAQRQFGADADDRLRDRLLEHMRLTLSRLNELAGQAIVLDDNPAARQRQAQRQDALKVLDSSLGQLARGLASLDPPPGGADATGAWRLANELFDRAEGRDMSRLLADSLEREDTALREKRAHTDEALTWLRRLWLATSAALVSAALLLAVGFTRALRRPLLGLTEGAAALRAGQLSHRIPLDGADEFSDVARSMNAMAEELTDHRRREAETRIALEEQVASRTAELSAALVALREAEARRRQLFADISHELRTPTTAIRGEAQVTLRASDNSHEDYRSSLRRIEEAARQLGLAIDDLLTMARSDIETMSLRRVSINLADVLREVVSQGEAIARAADVKLTHEPWPDNLILLGDADRLRQLLLTLIDNAIRYSRPGQTVQLEARRIEGGTPQLQVVVWDEGIGIAAEELPKVFERSHRAPNAKRFRSDGSGLGLPIARALARGHGGDVTLTSEIDRGTTAMLTLPLTAVKAEAAA